MTLWLPSNITSAVLQGWWYTRDATGGTADGATVTLSGSNVTSWADSSGNSRALPSTSGTVPTYGASALSSGHPGITFAVGQYLRIASGLNYPAGSVSAFVVGINTAASTNARLVSINQTGQADYGTAGAAANINYAGGALGSFSYIQNSSVLSTDSIGTAAGLMESYATAASGTSVTYTTAANGTPSGTVTPSSTIITGTFDQLGLATESDTVNAMWGGTVGEFVLISGVLSTSDLQKLEGYLAWNNGTNTLLPTGHPYYSAAPTVSGGGGATLTGVAGVCAVGSVSTQIFKPIAGVGTAGTLAASVASISKTLTAVSGSGAVGTMTPMTGTVVGLFGVSGSGAVAAVTASVSKSLTAVAALGAVNAPSAAAGGSATLSGVSGTGAVAAPITSATGSAVLTGVSATGAVGTLSASGQTNATFALVGVAAAGSVSALAIALASSLSGVAGSGAVAVPSPAGRSLLASVASTGAVGTISVGGGASVALTAVSATGAVVSPAVSTGGTFALPGVAGAGTVAAVLPMATLALASIAGACAVSTFAATTSDTASLNGVSGTGSVGTFAFSGSGSANLVAISAAGAVASPARGVTTTIVGVSGVGTVSAFATSQNATLALPSISATGQVQAPTISVSDSAGLTAIASSGIVSAVGPTANDNVPGIACTAVVGSLAAFGGIIPVVAAGAVNSLIIGGVVVPPEALCVCFVLGSQAATFTVNAPTSAFILNQQLAANFKLVTPSATFLVPSRACDC